MLGLQTWCFILNPVKHLLAAFIFFPFKTEGAYVFPFLPSANAYHNLLGAVLGWGDGVVASLSLRTQVLDETANVSAGAEDTLRTQSPGRQRPSVIPVPY